VSEFNRTFSDRHEVLASNCTCSCACRYAGRRNRDRL